MAKIFTSYSSDNKTPVQELMDDLSSLGHTIWFDHELVGGQAWWNQILNEIESCDFFLCALSDAYVKSDACKRELDHAIALNKTIIPIKLISDFDVRFLAQEIASLQITDVEAGNKKGVLTLINAINTSMPSPTVPNPLPTRPSIPVSYLSELLRDINSPEPLVQDQQAALIFKLRDHFRSVGDAAGVIQALDKLDARKDLLAKIGREVDALKSEIGSAQYTVTGQRDKPESVAVFRTFGSFDEVKSDLKEAVEEGKTDGAALGFGIVAFLFPFIGLILFFVWRKDKPGRAKLVSWAAAFGFLLYTVLLSGGDDSGYY